MIPIYSNYPGSQSTIAGSISATDTSVTLQSGAGAGFPTPTPGKSYFTLSHVNQGTGNPDEIVWVTARTGDVLTIARAQEGTTAIAWTAGDTVFNSISAGDLMAIVIDAQADAYNYTPTATFAADAYVVAVFPPITAYVDGLRITLKTTNSNATTTPTLDAGAGAVPIKLAGGPALSIGQMLSYANLTFIFNSNIGNTSSAAWELEAVSVPAPAAGVSAAEVQADTYNYAVDTGALNAFAVTLTPSVSAYTDGLRVTFRALAANTIVAPTLAVNGLTPTTIVNPDGSALADGQIPANAQITCIYNSALTQFELYGLPAAASLSPVDIQGGGYNYGVDTIGTGVNYAVTLTPAVSSYTPGIPVRVYAANSNTTVAPNLTVGSGSAETITNPGGSALVIGQIPANCVFEVVQNSTSGNFELQGLSYIPAAGAPISSVQENSYNFSSDTGAANAFAVALSPAITGYTDGLPIVFRAAHATTATVPTITINGLPAKNIINSDGSPLVPGQISAGALVDLIYNLTNDNFELQNNQQQPIGDNQTWQLITVASGTPYTNSTGRPIMIIVTAASTTGAPTTLTIVVDTLTLIDAVSPAPAGDTSSITCTIIVPNGSTYTITASTTITAYALM